MSVTVQTIREAYSIAVECNACDHLHTPAAFLLSDYAVSLRLCPAHALRLWQALGAMLAMGDPKLLKTVGTGAKAGIAMTAAGRKLF